MNTCRAKTAALFVLAICLVSSCAASEKTYGAKTFREVKIDSEPQGAIVYLVPIDTWKQLGGEKMLKDEAAMSRHRQLQSPGVTPMTLPRVDGWRQVIVLEFQGERTPIEHRFTRNGEMVLLKLN